MKKKLAEEAARKGKLNGNGANGGLKGRLGGNALGNNTGNANGNGNSPCKTPGCKCWQGINQVWFNMFMGMALVVLYMK